ncbi:MAG: C25 family cysteine peptidase [bacterium]
MKHIFMLGLLVVNALSADWKRVVGSSETPLPPCKEIIISDTLGVRIRTTMFGFSEQDTTVEYKEFKRIEIPEELRQESYDDTTLVGKPQIPYVRLLVAIPDSADLEVTVDHYGYTTFDDYLLYPTPRIVFEHIEGYAAAKEVYRYDTSFYQLDTIYPGIFYEVIRDGHWRDQRVLEVVLYPVQYNPKREIVYVYDELDIEITYSGTVGENENGMGPFESLGRQELFNYPGIDRQPPPHEPPAVHYYTDLRDTNIADYIIVTHEDFINDAVALDQIEQLAQWRVDHNEFDVGIVKTQDIYAQFDPQGHDSTQVRNFLIYAYANWEAPSMTDGHFGYCLFVGDWDYVPTCLKFDLEGDLGFFMLKAYEHYFRDLDTPMDDLDDIMLGRFPMKETNVQDLVTIVQKTVNYEQYPDNSQNWRRRGLLIVPTEEFEANIPSATPYYTDIGYDTLTIHGTDDMYDSVFCDSIQACINAGVIHTDWWGHGAPGGWLRGYDTAYVKQLANGDLLTFVLSHACLTGMFQWDHPWYGETPVEHPWHPGGISLGEHFLFRENGGAVAFEGSPIYVSRGNFVQNVLQRILRAQTWIIGQAVCNDRQFCLLGDPALDLGDYTAFPDLPDLVIRPRGLDVKFGNPFPYPANGDLIPVSFSVWNIGAVTAYDVEVKVRLKVPLFQDTATVATFMIDSITPRDSATVQFIWDPTVYPLDNGQTIVLPDAFEGEIGKADFSFVVDPDNDILESWEGNNVSRISHTLALYPNEPNWPKKLTPPVSQPAIGDLDGNGVPEIVVASWDSIYVFDASGNLLENWPEHFQDVHGIVLGDIDNDDSLEIVVNSDRFVRAYNSLGTLLWQNSCSSGYKFLRLPSLGRIDDPGSRYLDVILVADFCYEPPVEEGLLKVHVYKYDGTELYAFISSKMLQGNAHKSFLDYSAPAVSDINGDSLEEIVVSYIAIHDTVTDIFNRNSLNPLASFSYGGDLMTSALADINSDKFADVITGGIDGRIRAYDARNDAQLWERPTEGPINSAPVVGDVYPFPYTGIETAFGNDSGWVHLREKVLGDPLPGWPIQVIPNAMIRTSPALANMNAEQYLDIVFAANNNYVCAFEHDQDTIAPYPLPLFGKPSSPLIGDIDGDRESELVIASSDGYLHIWANRSSKVLTYALEWPQFHHDYQRTGLYNWVSRLSGGDANPKEFSTATTISFSLSDPLHTQIKVYDVDGNVVKDLVNQALPAGNYNPVWYGKDNNFALLPDGLYFIEIRANNESKIITVEINR